MALIAVGPRFVQRRSAVCLRAKMIEWVAIRGHFWNLLASPEGKGLALFLWGVGVRGFLAKKERSRTDQIWAHPPWGFAKY